MNQRGSPVPTTFEAGLVRCMPELQRYAHRLTGERTAAEDLVQDCLERALRNVDKFCPGTNLEAWLVTILKNIFFSQRRRQQLCTFCDLGDNDQAVPPAQVWCVALHETEEAIEALPPAPRHLVEMVVADGLAYQDIAARLDICVGTIRSRLSRAREQIRAILERRRRVCPQREPAPPHSLGAPWPSPSEPAPTGPVASSIVANPLRSARPSRRPRCIDRLRVQRRPDRPRVHRLSAVASPTARSRGPPSARRRRLCGSPPPPPMTVR